MQILQQMLTAAGFVVRPTAGAGRYRHRRWRTTTREVRGFRRSVQALAADVGDYPHDERVYDGAAIVTGMAAVPQSGLRADTESVLGGLGRSYEDAFGPRRSGC